MAVIQQSTAMLSDYRWQQQLLNQATQNLMQTSYSLQSVGQGLEAGSIYYTLFQQQLAALNELEKQITLQQYQLQQKITILDKQIEGNQKIVDEGSKKAFSYFA